MRGMSENCYRFEVLPSGEQTSLHLILIHHLILILIPSAAALAAQEYE
jgi:hypothetical protein